MTARSSNSRELHPVYLSVARRPIQHMLGGVMLGAALAAVAANVYTDGTRRVMLAYLVAFAFVLSLSLGSLFFVLIHHLTRAGWSVVVRRPAEIFGLNILTVAILFLPIAWCVLDGSGRLYPWAQRAADESQAHSTAEHHPVVHERAVGAGEHDAAAPHDDVNSLYVHQHLDELTLSKRSWLNPLGFVARGAVYFVVWGVIAWFYFRSSRSQDFGESDEATRRMEWWAGLSVFAVGITLTYAAFDFLMSLDPHWYSTIFGVYYFAGAAVGGLSLNLLAVLLLQRYQWLPDIVSDEHRRDLGRLLFAFVVFWAYIAFSQYMLLWYANMPETTRWLVVRGASTATGYANSWGLLLVLLLLAHFILPFFGIMSRHVKTNQNAMIFWTVWLLVLHYLDLYWLVMPELGTRLTIGLPELSTLLLVACVYLLGASLIATRTSLVPVNDPRLPASLAITDAY